MRAVAAMLPDGRLHLQHGPIDCICRAWGEAEAVRAAYGRACAVFEGILPGLVGELGGLRRAVAGEAFGFSVAEAMRLACLPYGDRFITPMAAVAGAVADHVLAAMCDGAEIARAFVNNGGDVALHVASGEIVLASPAGRLILRENAGVATSGAACKGRGGRSFSFGIADAVTVVADCAAAADAAASVIGNAVDLPGHRAVIRRPACAIDPESDLGQRDVTWEVGALSSAEVRRALDAGRVVADALAARGLIRGAALVLRGQVAIVGRGGALLEAA